MIVHKLRPVAMAILVLAAVTSLADDGVQLDLDANHAASKPGSEFSLALFVAEVTPPIGHSLQAGVGVKPAIDIADPLFAHGFVLLGVGEPIVLCSVDWCGIGNDAHDRWHEVLAEAAGTTRERVLVCAIHQHDAPLVDLEAERLID